MLNDLSLVNSFLFYSIIFGLSAVESENTCAVGALWGQKRRGVAGVRCKGRFVYCITLSSGTWGGCVITPSSGSKGCHYSFCSLPRCCCCFPGQCFFFFQNSPFSCTVH